MTTFEAQHLRHYTTSQLDTFVAEGYSIPADVYLEAKHREGITDEHIRERRRLDKLASDAEETRRNEIDAHRPALSDALAAVEEAYDEAAAKLRVRDAADNDFRRAIGQCQRACSRVENIVKEHFTDFEVPSRSDPLTNYDKTRLGNHTYIDGAPFLHRYDGHSLRRRPAYRETDVT